MSLKVVFVLARSDEIGGAHIHVKDMANHVILMGGQAVVVAGGNGVFADLIRANGIRFISIPSLGREISVPNDLFALFCLNKVIRGLRYDLVSAHSAKAGLLIRLLGLGPDFPPVIFTAHGWSFAFGIPVLQRKFYLYLERFLSLLPAQIITVCNSDRLLALAQGVSGASKMSVIYNGMPSLPRHFRPSFKLRSDPRVQLVSIARYEKQKDHDTLLRALASIPGDNWRLSLIGDGPDLESVKRLASQLGILANLDFLGRCQNVPFHLDSADIFVLSSHWEGFPRSILEAMRSSLPVVASNVGGVSESVIDNFNGFCIPPRDIHALASALLKLISNPELRMIMGDRGRSLFDAKFTFSRMSSETWDLYCKVLKS